MSYRREEASVHAGVIYEAVAARFGQQNVFIDVDLEPAVNFVERLSQLLSACHVMLVVIGPKWATIENGQGRRRLFETRDFVRFEVETALRRPDVKVMPLLVAGARMPDPEQLPESLRELPDLNGIEISDDLRRRRDDVRRLISWLEGILSGTSPQEQVSETEPEPPSETPSIARPLLEGVLVAAAAGVAGGLIGGTIDPRADADTAAKISTTVLQRALTWAVVGAAIAIWVTILRGESRATVGRGLAGLTLGAVAGAVGGAIFGAAVYLPESVTPEAAKQVQIGAVAATGGVLGALLGQLWIPARAGPGLLAGAGGGALAQLVLKAGDWGLDPWLAVSFRCVLIVAFVLATMFALDALRTPATSAGVRPAT